MNPNIQQEAVINHGDGPCLVVAVPGSGKTACLTERIRRLVDSGIDPRRILAVTFTNKAAKELKQRLKTTLGDQVAQDLTSSTFHSLCAKLLRTFHEQAGIPKDYIIYDADDQGVALNASICEVRDIEDKSDIEDHDYQTVLSYIESTRNACLDDGSRSMMQHVWQYQAVDKYYEKLKLANAVDFTGLLFKVLEILNADQTVLRTCQSRWDYISVDEVQDTNVLQYEIIKRIAGKHKNLFMVGDIHQSIFGFRLANPENLFKFEEEFGAVQLKIEKNYRSTPQILKHAQKLIERNTFKKDTTLTTDNPSGPDPDVICEIDQDLMAQRIAETVSHRIRGGTHPNEIAVLYRIKSASRVIEKALRSVRVNYKVIGGFSFWDYVEVKACVSLLRLMANPNDQMAFERVADYCLSGVGSKSVAKITQMTSSVDLMTAAKSFSEGGSKQALAVRTFLSAMDAAKSMSPGAGVTSVLHATGFWNKISEKNNDKTGLDRHENINEVTSDVDEYLGKSESNTVAGYLQEVSLLTSTDEEQKDNEVSLMTIHAAKGLEFEVVIISHVNQEIIPHWNALNPSDPSMRNREIEEERRLMYVAMTRSKKWLYLALCQTRFNKTMKPSQFISEAGLY